MLAIVHSLPDVDGRHSATSTGELGPPSKSPINVVSDGRPYRDLCCTTAQPFSSATRARLVPDKLTFRAKIFAL